MEVLMRGMTPCTLGNAYHLDGLDWSLVCLFSTCPIIELPPCARTISGPVLGSRHRNLWIKSNLLPLYVCSNFYRTGMDTRNIRDVQQSRFCTLDLVVLFELIKDHTIICALFNIPRWEDPGLLPMPLHLDGLTTINLIANLWNGQEIQLLW